MKRKLLTLLMSIFMVFPLAGCGEPNMSNEPKANEAKILLHFTETEDGSNFTENQSQLKMHYSDCADLTGYGFYKVGETARINIDYNNKACTFSGWRMNGSLSGSLPTLPLTINNDMAGKTINVYAIMSKNGDAVQLNTTSLSLNVSDISVTSYGYNEDELIELDENNEITLNIGGSQVKFEYIEADEAFVGSDDTYEIDTTNNAVMFGSLNDVYTLVYESGKLIGLIKTNINNPTGNTVIKSLTTKEELDQYMLPNSKLTFFDMIQRIETKNVYNQGEKFGSLFPETNLSYFTKDGNVQQYAINWKYSEGPCGIATTPIEDPNTFVFRTGVTNYCLSANIDLRPGLKTDYIKNAVKSTLLNQMYIYTNPEENSACEGVENGTASITTDCMFVRNMGLLEDKIIAGEAQKDYMLFYYAVNEDTTTDAIRLEAIEDIFQTLHFKSQTKGMNESGYSTSVLYDYTNLDRYGLKITPIYKKLIEYYNNPDSAKGKITFGFSRFNKNVAIDSMVLDGKTYYFNYVQDGEGGFYTPKGDNPLKPAQSSSNIPTTLYELVKFVNKQESLMNNDEKLLNKLWEKISSNPENMISATGTTNIITNVTNTINVLVNTPEFKALNKYEFKVSKGAGDGDKVIVTYEDRILEIDSEDYNFVSVGNEIHFLNYTQEEKYDVSSLNLNKPVNYNLDTLLATLNILTNPSALPENASIKITSSNNNVTYEISDRGILKIRLTKTSDKTYRLMSPTDPNRVEIEVTFKKLNVAGNIEGIVDNIKLASYTGVELHTTRSEELTPLTLYRISISEKYYYVNLQDNEVYDSEFNVVAKLNKTLGINYTHWFAIETQNEEELYFGIFSNKSIMELDNQGKEKPNTSVTPEKLQFVTFNETLYVVTEDKGTYSIDYKGGTTLTFEDGKYTIVLNDIVVTGIEGEKEDYDIYKLYGFLNGADYYADSSKLVAVDAQKVVYQLTETQNNSYKVTYNGIEYEVQFKSTSVSE